MNASRSVALRIERHDAAYGFEDHVPGDLSVERLTRLAAPRVRLPLVDVSTGKPIAYSLLDGGNEVPQDTTVGRAFPQGRGRCTIVTAFQNA